MKRPANTARPARLNSSLASSDRQISSFMRGANGHLANVRMAVAAYLWSKKVPIRGDIDLEHTICLVSIDETESDVVIPSSFGNETGKAQLMMLHARFLNRYQHAHEPEHVNAFYLVYAVPANKHKT